MLSSWHSTSVHFFPLSMKRLNILCFCLIAIFAYLEIVQVMEIDEILDVDKEYGKPPESAFIGLGWDVDAQTKRKHYRRFFPDELENIRNQFHMVSPF